MHSIFGVQKWPKELMWATSRQVGVGEFPRSYWEVDLEMIGKGILKVFVARKNWKNMPTFA